MSEGADMTSQTSEATGAQHMTLGQMPTGYVADGFPLVAALSRVLLAGDDGYVMPKGDVLAGESPLEAVVLLHDYLLPLKRRVNAHFSQVRRLAYGAVLTSWLGESACAVASGVGVEAWL